MKSRLAHSTAGILAAGLLLISCSSDSDTGDDDNIEGVETGEQESSNSPSSSEIPKEDDGIERPEINLPDDMNNVFEDTETGDATKDAIIADVMGGIDVTDMAFAAGDPGLEEMEFYHTGEGLVSARQFVRRSADADLSWAGTVVYYDFTVDNNGYQETRPIVGYCQDITELRDKDLKTGEILPLTGEDPQFFLYTQVVVRQNDLGVWQVERVLPASEELDGACER